MLLVMKPKKSPITMTFHIPERVEQPLTADERNQLTEFFTALIDLDHDENVTKGNAHAKLYKRDSNHTN